MDHHSSVDMAYSVKCLTESKNISVFVNLLLDSTETEPSRASLNVSGFIRFLEKYTTSIYFLK